MSIERLSNKFLASDLALLTRAKLRAICLQLGLPGKVGLQRPQTLRGKWLEKPERSFGRLVRLSQGSRDMVTDRLLKWLRQHRPNDAKPQVPGQSMKRKRIETVSGLNSLPLVHPQ